MSASADILSCNRSATQSASKVAVLFKKFFAKLYVALDEMQRKRAAEIIRRYKYLIPESDEHSDEQKKSVSVRGGRLRIASVLA
jgi:hypothetical protein